MTSDAPTGPVTGEPADGRTPTGRPLGWLAAPAVTPLLRWAVLVHSVPGGEPWRSNCPHCDTPLHPAMNLGALLPPARCGGCRHRIGAAPYAVEVAALIAAGLVGLAVIRADRSWWEAGAFATWAAVAVALTFVDLAVHRLPFRLSVPATAVAVGLLGLAALTGDAGDAWWRALIAGGVCGLGFALVTLIFGARSFGLGDAVMAVGAGVLLGWLGWGAVLVGLFLAFLGSGLVGVGLLLTRRAGRRDALPFGPYLAVGTLLTLAWIS